jgi:hypothetical protein
MNRRRRRDRSLLHIAAFAATGGLLSIGFSIGVPVCNALHHRVVTPEFFFFGGWGLLALFGAAGCIHTYFVSGDPPEKPPNGGIPVREFTVLEGGKKRAEVNADARRRAA